MKQQVIITEEMIGKWDAVIAGRGFDTPETEGEWRVLIRDAVEEFLDIHD